MVLNFIIFIVLLGFFFFNTWSFFPPFDSSTVSFSFLFLLIFSSTRGLVSFFSFGSSTFFFFLSNSLFSIVSFLSVLLLFFLYLCYILTFIYIYIYTCVYMQKESQRHNDKGRAKTSLEKYVPLTLFVTFACERELVTEQNCNILTSTLMAISVVVFSFSWCSTGGPGAHSAGFSTASYHQLVWSLNSIRGPEGPFGRVWLSLPHLVSITSDLQLLGGAECPLCRAVVFSTTSYHRLLWFLTRWLPVLTELYNSSMPTQSPTQSLEWHVWSSSSGNNCHAVQRSLSSSASVYECIMGFYLVPFRQPNSPTRFLSITGHWDVSLPSGASLWNGMFGRVEGQYTTSPLQLVVLYFFIFHSIFTFHVASSYFPLYLLAQAPLLSLYHSLSHKLTGGLHHISSPSSGLRIFHFA